MASPHLARRPWAVRRSAAWPPREGLSRTRRATALGLALVGVPVLTAALVTGRGTLGLDSVLLIYLLAVVVVAVVGGLLPAMLGAVVSFLLANWFLTPPYGTLQVQGRDRLIQLVVFVVVAALVSAMVDLGARNAARGERHRLEARVLARLTSSEIGATTPEGVLRQIRQLFELYGVELVDPRAPQRPTLTSVGTTQDGEQTLSAVTASGLVVRGAGPHRIAEDNRLFVTLAETAARAWQERQLAAEAGRAQELAERDRVRAALLAAVGHDLRTPLSGIKAAVSTLRQEDIAWTKDDTDELLAAIETGTDRLTEIISNLLDMSRIRAGALSVQLEPVALDEVLGRALMGTDVPDPRLDVPEDLPPLLTDPGLLERVLVNLLDNAARFSPPGAPVTVRARHTRGEVVVDIIDHGPGVPAEQFCELFVPFHRLGNPDGRSGVGLGLAIAQGLSSAVGAVLSPDTTTGGGLTMRLRTPVAP